MSRYQRDTFEVVSGESVFKLCFMTMAIERTASNNEQNNKKAAKKTSKIALE